MDAKTPVNWTFSALEMLAEIHDNMMESSESSAEKYVGDLVDYIGNNIPNPALHVKIRNLKLWDSDVATSKIISSYIKFSKNKSTSLQ